VENRILIDEFNKNSVEKVKIITYEWNGKYLLDIRAWILQNPTDPESQMPTKKGIMIRTDSLPDLINALEKARETLKKQHESTQETTLGQS